MHLGIGNCNRGGSMVASDCSSSSAEEAFQTGGTNSQEKSSQPLTG